MSKQIKVGLFVLLGLVMTTVIIFLIGEGRGVWSRKVAYTASFADVVGLKAGAPVRMGGFDVGSVTDVTHSSEVTDTRIYITM
jgi:phospholipid/cholesterol/gamma-HCH transport system substrate-binding protein